jgi:hypothetical protein
MVKVFVKKISLEDYEANHDLSILQDSAVPLGMLYVSATCDLNDIRMSISKYSEPDEHDMRQLHEDWCFLDVHFQEDTEKLFQVDVAEEKSLSVADIHNDGIYILELDESFRNRSQTLQGRDIRRSSSPKIPRWLQRGPSSLYRYKPSRTGSLETDVPQSNDVLDLSDIKLPNLMDTPEESDVYDDEPEQQRELCQRRPTEIILNLPPTVVYSHPNHIDGEHPLPPVVGVGDRYVSHHVFGYLYNVVIISSVVWPMGQKLQSHLCHLMKEMLWRLER